MELCGHWIMVVGVFLLEMEVQVCGFGITKRIGVLQECFGGFKVVARDAGAEALQPLHDGRIGIRTTIAAEFA